MKLFLIITLFMAFVMLVAFGLAFMIVYPKVLNNAAQIALYITPVVGVIIILTVSSIRRAEKIRRARQQDVFNRWSHYHNTGGWNG
jgi:hypothetical protein